MGLDTETKYTVMLPDEVFRAMKHAAIDRHTTARQVIIDALRRELNLKEKNNGKRQ